ncbi:MAG: murein biosynthesis integral membrane protein MurJ [Candidatus Pacebacteria bacterium]|nr:murein biosynthesis integral membrane protein MurJ [Candidatus Paceibacterota bacterium]
MFKSKILRSGVILGAFSFLASLVGLLRDRIFTSEFGASRTLDIYYSAFKVPDLVFNILLLGAVSSAFLPVFISEFKRDESSAWRIAHNFTTITFGLVLFFSALLWVFAGSFASLIAPGFIGADRQLVVSLTRIMLLSPILFSLSTICGSILQSFERFWAYAIAPVLYNVGIILGAIYLVPIFRSHGYPEVYGLGWGVVLGAFMHFVLQYVAARRAGFRFKTVFDLGDHNFRKIFRLMIPRTIGLGAYSIDSTVINAIASTLGVGSIAVLNVANNIQFVPISMVGISMAIAVFPRLSQHASSDEHGEFKDKIKQSLVNSLLIVVPLSLAGFFLAHWGISLLFGAGLYQGSSVDLTAKVLMAFMIGIPAQSVIPILSRAFYALQNTRIPVSISIASIMVNWLGAWLFGIHYHWGVVGLAMAFSVAGNINAILLWLFLRRYQKMV